MTIRSARRWALLAVATCTAAAAGAQTTVGTTTPGVGTPAPFGGTMWQVRFQQAYDASLFAGPLTIGAITFHYTQFVQAGAELTPGGFAFYLSTTSVAANTLGGAPLTGNVTGPAHFFGAVVLGGVAPTALTIAGSPFTYDPAAGNLLLDIRITPTGVIDQGAYFDGDFGTNLMSAAYEMQFPGMPLSPAVPAVSLVTTFDGAAVSAVPEPGSLALAANGLLALTGIARVRRRGAAG